VVYSGGRDKALYATHMGRRKAWLLARENQPIRSIVSVLIPIAARTVCVSSYVRRVVKYCMYV
jgi:hypothetical protein